MNGEADAEEVAAAGESGAARGVLGCESESLIAEGGAAG